MKFFKRMNMPWYLPSGTPILSWQLWRRRLGAQKSWHCFQEDLGFIITNNGFPDSLMCKESACNAGDMRDASSIPGLGRFSGKGNGNPLQYSCRDNPTDRGDLQATIHGAAKSQTQLRDYACPHAHMQTLRTCQAPF